MIGLLVSGVLPWTWLANVYALSIFMISINYLRGLSSHRFRSVGEPANYRDQVLDSTTIPDGILTGLICPIGMRYHALHHVCPSMPYHNMGIAHRRLMARLPQNSAYHYTLRRSVWHALGDLAGTVHDAYCRRLYQAEPVRHDGEAAVE
jgi:fatty acid desaturase